jgi:hypothetical protein
MSQAQEILQHMKQGNSLTPAEALHKFGCFRLAARVDDLRKAGHDVKTVIVEMNGKRFAEYRL